MTASIRFDQVGLPASTGPGARTDGLNNGARVTVRNDSGAPCRVELLWVPPDDATVVASLGQAAPAEWYFDPQAARHGSYLCRLIEREGTADESIDEKLFGIRLPLTNVLIPALNEKGDPLITIADSVSRKEKAAAITHNNEPNPQGLRYLGWWQAMADWLLAMETVASGTGSGGIFPVKAFGAIGNGIADDTAAINATIAAAQAVNGTVLFAPGTYRTTSALLITAQVAFVGSGPRSAIIVIDAADRTILRITPAASDVDINGLTFRGNNTGVGGFVTGMTGGHGIAIDQATRVRISNCRFQQFGVLASVHGQYACPIVGTNVVGLTVDTNFFDSSNHNRTGSDVQVSGQDILVTNNKSRSFCDTFCNLGRHTNGETRHTVTANQAYRAPSAVSRSGVLIYYDGTTPAFANITNNHFDGFYWHGVYATSVGSVDAGAIIIAANTITFCGGGWGEIDTSSVFWPGAGIRVVGRGFSVVGNDIYGTGYTGPYSAPVARPNTATGILCLNYFEHSSIVGNVIRKSTNGGISLFVQGSDPGDLVRFVTVSANVIEDNSFDGIVVAPARTNAECCTDITVVGNTVRVPDAVARGIALLPANGAWANRINFDGNIIAHTNPPVSGTVAGIQRPVYSDFTRNTGRIVGNTINGFRNGINFVGTPATLYVPFAVLVEGNTILGAQLGLDFAGSTNWGVHLNTTGNPASFMSNAGARAGRIIGSVTGRPAVEMMSDQQPTSGTWVAGDTQLYYTPRGDMIGNRCVVGGTPGVWEPIYRESGFGMRMRANAAFNLNSLQVQGFDPSDVLSVGTVTPRAWDTNRFYTRKSQLEYLETVASTSAVAGVYTDAPEFSPAASGFHIRIIWAPATGMSVGTRRAFAGMVASNAAPTDVEPSSQTQMIGMGYDAADAQVQIMYAAAGASTKTALGASFPKPTVDRTLVYALEIYWPGPGGLCVVRVRELSAATPPVATEVGIIAANMPTVALNPFTAWASVGGTSGVAGVAFADWRAWRSV